MNIVGFIRTAFGIEHLCWLLLFTLKFKHLLHINLTGNYLFKDNNKNTRYPVGIYLFKFKSGNTRKKWEIFLKLTLKTPERRHWHRSGVFIVNFEHTSHLFLVFLLLPVICLLSNVLYFSNLTTKTPKQHQLSLIWCLYWFCNFKHIQVFDLVVLLLPKKKWLPASNLVLTLNFFSHSELILKKAKYFCTNQVI